MVCFFFDCVLFTQILLDDFANGRGYKLIYDYLLKLDRLVYPLTLFVFSLKIGLYLLLSNPLCYVHVYMCVLLVVCMYMYVSWFSPTFICVR